MNNIDKNNLNKLSVSNEIAKDIFTDTQNNKRKRSRGSKNKLNAKYTKNFDGPTKYPKDNKNNLKKLNTFNAIAKDTFTNMQNNKRKKSYDSKNELDAKYTENSDSLTKYSKNNKNNIKKLSISNEITKDIFTNMQKSKKKKLRDLKKNKLDAKYIENANAPTNYPKDDKKTISKVQNNSNIKIKCEKNKKRKQDMNLNPTNKNDVRINEDDEDDSSEDNGSKSIKKKEEKLKKLQMEVKDLKFMMSKLIEGNNEENMKQMSTKVETQQIQSDILKLNKHKINIKYLKKMLENKLQVTKVTQSTLRDKKLTLRDRMQMQLKASRFRFINETLYNNDSSQSKHYFQKEPDSFMAYHAGYKQQIEQWPINPLDVIISSIKKLYIIP